MDIGVLGSGMVGETLGSGLVKLGHTVMMGTRSPAKPEAVDWAGAHGMHARYGTFADAAAFGEIVFNCTNGEKSLAALEMAGAGNLAGKVLVDVANPLDFSAGMPPTLTVCNTDSLGERIQRAYPDTRVVKALNTVNCVLMLDPGLLAEDTDLFLCGDDTEAKKSVIALLKAAGWKRFIDLGGIKAARATEMMVIVWVHAMQAIGTAEFNFRLVKNI